MYRHAALHLPCESCRIERARAALALSARGGYVCWRCQIKQQIDEHTRLAYARERLRGPLWLMVLALLAVTAALTALLNIR
jgi:hypothetical protein